MIRESNTLTWQETAEQKKMMRRRYRASGAGGQHVNRTESAGCCCYLAVS